jgi:hypothetical protein
MTEGIPLRELGAGDLGFDLIPRDVWGAYSCPDCHSRPRYRVPDARWISRRLNKDIGFTPDAFFLVSGRFAEWIRRESIQGVVLTQVGDDAYFLDAVEVDLDEERSGLLKSRKTCLTCGMKRSMLFKPSNGIRRIRHVAWPFGEQRVIARSKQLAGEGFRRIPSFFLSQSLVGLAKAEQFSGRMFPDAVGIPCSSQEAPESVIHRRSAPASPGKGRSASPEAVLASLLAMLAHPAPAFVCRNADGRSPAAPIPLRHTAQPPALAEDVEAARKLLGKRAALYLELFSRHDGVRLYEEPVHGEPGVALGPIRDWPALTQQCREALPPSEPMDGLRANDPFVAIGQAESAGAYLVVMTRGALAGQVRVVQPAGWSVSVLATNLAELVDALCDPVPLIQNSLGQTLRYSDGIRRGEYFPVEYLPGVGAGAAAGKLPSD